MISSNMYDVTTMYDVWDKIIMAPEIVLGEIILDHANH